LHYATVGRHVDMVRLLLACGADPSIQSIQGKTPLQLLAVDAKKEDDAIEAMLASWERDRHYAQNPSLRLHLAVSQESSLAVLILLMADARVDAVDRDQRTPLHLAVIKGNQNAVRYLLRYGANRLAQDGQGRTPIEYATALAPQLQFHLKQLLS